MPANQELVLTVTLNQPKFLPSDHLFWETYIANATAYTVSGTYTIKRRMYSQPRIGIDRYSKPTKVSPSDHLFW
jgi:hypothetical protein